MRVLFAFFFFFLIIEHVRLIIIVLCETEIMNVNIQLTSDILCGPMFYDVWRMDAR